MLDTDTDWERSRKGEVLQEPIICETRYPGHNSISNHLSTVIAVFCRVFSHHQWLPSEGKAIEVNKEKLNPKQNENNNNNNNTKTEHTYYLFTHIQDEN